jgi:ATP-dependent DNA helicase RecQ
MIQKTLQEKFGFDDFLEGQKEVIERVLAGDSAVAVFPTGAGKSLCYQLPALHLEGLTLVVSPLLSLMKDQLDFLLSKNIAADKLDSGMSRQAYQAALEAARDGRIKILMISVERFKNERFRLQLSKLKISLLVVDEAHCISEWGHNFRPDYLKIPAYRRAFNIPQVLLLTATATPAVREDMCRKFGIAEESVFTTGFFRKNLHLKIVPAPSTAKTSALQEALNQAPTGPAIVYVIQQKTAEVVAQQLCEAGFDAAAYHAGMKSEQRQEIQNRFMADEIGIVVATIAFGMGIDKSDIRKVIHFDLPKSIESYSQEIGRAGRDGKPSICSVLGDRTNVPLLENFVYGDTPEKSGIARVLQQIKESAEKPWEVRLYALSGDSDIRILPLKTLLVYLETMGIIRPRYVYFEDYPFKFIASPADIAARFAAERKTFVEALFAHTTTAKVWSRPDIEAIVRATGSQRERVIAALDYFDANGWIELQPKTSVEVFAVTQPDFPLEETADRLFERFIARQDYEIRRIGQMIELLEAPGCLAAGLSAYFGEQLAQPCGTCTPCRSAGAVRLPEAASPPLDGADFHALTQDLLDDIAPPASPTLVTRFLCGINTPRLTRSGARRLKRFGCMSTRPYGRVYEWVQREMQEE